MATRQNESQITKETNPCWAEGKASLQCLSKNNYDRNACASHFDNYNQCKKFWLNVQRARKASGIKPALPPLSEREGIKKKFQETGTIPTSG